MTNPNDELTLQIMLAVKLLARRAVVWGQVPSVAHVEKACERKFGLVTRAIIGEILDDALKTEISKRDVLTAKSQWFPDYSLPKLEEIEII